jgi:hypothetical protein
LVGSPTATPALPASSVAIAETTPPKKILPPPLKIKTPPPPPDDSPDDRWGGRHSCTHGPNGQMVCPPYGCVFPDEACDIVSV